MSRFRTAVVSLTSRLVITVVLLVAVVSLLVAFSTTLAMRNFLTHRLDDDINGALHRAENPASAASFVLEGPSGPRRPDQGLGDLPDIPGQGVGTLTAYYLPSYKAGLGKVITDAGREGITRTNIDADLMAALLELPADGQAHPVDLPGVGSYRVAVSDENPEVRVIVGLPTDDVDETVSSLVRFEVLLAMLGVVVAGFAGYTVVRRQLRDLREVARTANSVAALPLDTGAIGITERVPTHLTDADTEVGQVGAALNTLLAHVETSLDARHRSELRVRQFVADASHELRTPLTTIAGYTQLARRRPDDAEASATALAKVEEESARMTSLVEDLLLLARLDSGRPLEQAPVDLTRLLLEAVADAQVLAPGHHWRLDLPEEAIEVTGDEQRLHQAVTNLLTNARKYTPEGTTVTVSARSGGFCVHDDGPGFPPGLAEHAFERFARGDVARHREGGVGLGLALVEAITTAHGGTVQLSSAPGDTRVDVRLGPALQ